MAKALLGYVGGVDPHMAHDTARLRRRVRDLEEEVLRLKKENEALHVAVAENLDPEKLLDSVSH